MPQFFPLPQPYTDCALISFADPTAAHHAANQLRTRLQPHQLAVHVGSDLGNPMCVLVTSSREPVAQRHNQTFIFSGFGNIRGRFVFGQAALNAAVDAVREESIGSQVGQFTFFAITPGNITAEHDLFGYGQLFASEHAHCSIVSNRLHLQRLVIAALGLPVELDAGPASAFLFSNHVFFSQQNIGPEMLVEGVIQVPLNKRVMLTEGRLSLLPKTDFLDCLQASPGAYDELVDVGVRDIVDNATAILENLSFERVIVDLTGGKDSRMVFGSVLHHPAWRRRVMVNTQDVPGSRDLEIACGIANLFGARFFAGESAPVFPVSADGNLHLWRSYFHGLYHRIGASAWSPTGLNTRSISLSGGNGEVFRTFWTANLQRYLVDGDDEHSFVKRFVAAVALGEAATDSHTEMVMALLQRTLETLPGANLKERLEAHYLYFRNRAHFGMRGFSFYHERPTWFPLMSAALLKAAHSLPFEERAAGRLVRDVTSKLHPLLQHIEYDGHGFDQFAAARYTAAETPLRLQLDTSRDGWEAATAATEAQRAQARAGLRATMVWRDWPEHVLNEALRAYEEARGASAVCRDILNGQYVDIMQAEFAAKSRKAFEMASRLLAIRDSVSS